MEDKTKFFKAWHKNQDQERETKGRRKNFIVVELSTSLEQVPFHHLHYFLAHRMRQ
jgi:hypothetical protein